MKDPLLVPLAAVVAGILLSRGVRFERTEAALALAAFALLTLIAWRTSRRMASVAGCLALLSLGVTAHVLRRPGHAPSIDASSRESVLLSGCVVEPPVLFEGRDQFTVALAPHAAARVSLTLHEGQPPPELRYGQNVEFEGHIRPVRNFGNPAAFDFETYQARRDIYWTASALSGTPVRILPGSCGLPFWRAIFALRTAALERIENLYAGNAYDIGMMDGILIGESGKLEKVWTGDFRRTGTFHALVISGLHISVLAATLLFLLRVCFVPELPALGATAVAAWTYALVSGWSAPVVRAAGGFTLFLIARFFFRRTRLLNLLAAVALPYLLFDPEQLFDASFQLSFSSVAAIGAIAAPLIASTSGPLAAALRGIAETSRDLRLSPNAAQFRIEVRLFAETLAFATNLSPVFCQRVLALLLRMAFYVFETVLLSTVIQIGLALPMALYFHRISFSGLSANVLIVPLLSLVVPVGFLAIFTDWHFPAQIAGLLLTMSGKIAAWHVQWEPDRRVPDPPVWLSLLFVAALLALAFTLTRPVLWRCAAGIAVLGLFALIFAHPFRPHLRPGTLELTAIDVGQGDGLLLGLPDGKVLMIDGGGIPAWGRKVKSRLDIGEDVVSPYLWSRSIQRLDAIVCTHAHEDHTGGIAALIDNFHPRELWTGATPEDSVWRELRAHTLAHHVRIVPMTAGAPFPYGGASVQVLSPPADYQAAEKPKNNDSLVLRVAYGRHAFLLTGDMEKPMEYRLLADNVNARADVLKVGHHGSKTSSTDGFLDAVHPAFALISDGYENSFGHPHPDVLARFAERRTAVYRTDRNGLITVRTDGAHLSLESMRR